MRVFPDTNVLASAFATRGLCADLVRVIVERHELVTSEAVIGELTGVLARKFRLSADEVRGFERFLRSFEVRPLGAPIAGIRVRERADKVVLGSANGARIDLFATGDKELIALRSRHLDFRIVSPRDCWIALAAGDN